MKSRILTYAVSIAIGCLAAICLMAMTSRSQAMIYGVNQKGPAGDNNTKLQRMYEECLADRVPKPGESRLTTSELGARDVIRLKQVREMYEEGKVRTGQDCYNAAVILQHGRAPEDFILAHDLAVLAVSMGVDRAKWLSAATEDRFLISIGRPQRFATQYDEARSFGFQRLYPVDQDVTDSHRLQVGSVTLSDAVHLERRRLKS